MNITLLAHKLSLLLFVANCISRPCLRIKVKLLISKAKLCLSKGIRSFIVKLHLFLRCQKWHLPRLKWCANQFCM